VSDKKPWVVHRLTCCVSLKILVEPGEKAGVAPKQVGTVRSEKVHFKAPMPEVLARVCHRLERDGPRNVAQPRHEPVVLVSDVVVRKLAFDSVTLQSDFVGGKVVRNETGVFVFF